MVVLQVHFKKAKKTRKNVKLNIVTGKCEIIILKSFPWYVTFHVFISVHTSLLPLQLFPWVNLQHILYNHKIYEHIIKTFTSFYPSL